MLLGNYCEHDCLVICAQVFVDRERERESIIQYYYMFIFSHFRNVDIFYVEICIFNVGRIEANDPRYLDFDYLE